MSEEKKNEMILDRKIDFMLLFTAKKASPNSDFTSTPLRDRMGHGEVTQGCIKRHLRNELFLQGEEMFYEDGGDYDSGEFVRTKDRFFSDEFIKKHVNADKIENRSLVLERMLDNYLDVRLFGGVFPAGKKQTQYNITGPVTLNICESVDPINISCYDITKAKMWDTPSDTKGEMRVVDFGLYVLKGSIEATRAGNTKLTYDDVEKFKDALCNLFVHDTSNTRPAGSIELRRLYWWTHPNHNGTNGLSTGKVHRSVHIEKRDNVTTPSRFEDYVISHEELDGPELEIIEL